MPVFLVLGLCAGAMFALSGQPLVGAAQLVINELNSPTLMALPLFVMAAAFMRFGGIAKALVDLAAAWLGGLPGSLGLVTVVACTLFAAICGSSVATALAMGTILIPAMLERGYPRIVRARRRRRVGNDRHRHSAEPAADPVRHRRRAVGAAAVPRRHSSGPAAGRRVLPLGAVRSPPPQISGRAGAAVQGAAAGDAVGPARAARAARRHGRHLWRLRHGDRSCGALRRGGARRFAGLLSRLPLDRHAHRSSRTDCAAPPASC